MNIHALNAKVVISLIVQLINVKYAIKMDAKYVNKMIQINVLFVILSFIWLLQGNAKIAEFQYQDVYNVIHLVYVLIVM